MRDFPIIRAKPEHPYAWLWEPLEAEPSFELRAMFGAKAVYLGGKLQLCFIAKDEPWCGLLVCTDQTQHGLLIEEFPMLRPHPILPKWLYLPESSGSFESAARKLVTLVRKRDGRIGVAAKSKRQSDRKSSARKIRKGAQ